MQKIMGREPAVFWAMVATLLQALLLLFDFNDELHGAANAAILAVAGLVTALYVSVDAALPMLTGVIKAVFALVLALGLEVPASTQVAILSVVTALGAFFVRQSVTAKVNAEGNLVAP